MLNLLQASSLLERAKVAAATVSDSTSQGGRGRFVAMSTPARKVKACGCDQLAVYSAENETASTDLFQCRD